MKKRISYFTLISFFSLFFVSFVQGQVDTLWTRTFGGVEEEMGSSVQQTNDGGYVIVGFTRSFGNGGDDLWLIRTDNFGDTLWTKTHGGDFNDYGWSIRKTNDENFIVVGTIFSTATSENEAWLLKTNYLGDTLWTKTYSGENYISSYDVQQTYDGGYIILCHTYLTNGNGNDILLIKTNNLGITDWNRTIGGLGGDYGYSIIQTTDGGYLIVGETNSYSIGNYDSDIWLVKTDDLGDTLWTKVYAGASLTNECGYSVQQTIDGGYILAGYKSESSTNNQIDAWLIKTDQFGDTIWTKTYGGAAFAHELAYSVQQTIDGGYILTGSTETYGVGDFDVWLIKTNELGDTLWTKTFGGYEKDEGLYVQQTSDNGYIIVGYTQSFDEGNKDVYLIKTTPDLSKIEQSGDKINIDYSVQQNYPNPFNSMTTINYKIKESSHIRIVLYDLSGKEIEVILDQHQPPGNYHFQWNSRDLASGIYFYTLILDDKPIITKKAVLIK